MTDSDQRSEGRNCDTGTFRCDCDDGKFVVRGRLGTGRCRKQIVRGDRISALPSTRFLRNIESVANEFFWDAPVLKANMLWRVTLNSKYDGSFGITQLLRSSGGIYDTGGYWYLDGDDELYEEKVYTASKPNPDSHRIELFDTPEPGALIAYTGFYSMVATFKDYLRFKPEGNDCIWVTIATNGWSMEAHVAGFSVSYTNIPPASAPVDNDQFPDWDGVRHVILE